ncbi:UNVERIFIED_ORG: drug/metabolite transporter (DMT)-like permease [Paraburkholderia sediminicola]|nr:drug/metabolite transporter (DMT)-like permease [Paraburkholderia sediminicola]
MKMSHRLGSPDTAGPVWGVVFGVFMTAIGMGLWFYASSSIPPGRQDESLAVAAMLIGLFSVVYAGRELCHKRR